MYGKYKHSVDPKGRLFVPSKLREELGDDTPLTPDNKPRQEVRRAL